MSDYEAMQSARNSAAKALQAANPNLVPVSAKVDSLQAAGKNVRIELKRAFPGVKFSVKTSRYSMGCSLSVNWVDGPNADQVSAISGKYSGGSFNGSEDLYEYSRDAWTDAFGDAKYVSDRRDYSDKAVASAIRTVQAKYAGNLSARNINEIKVEDLRAGRLWNVEVMGNWSDYLSLQAIINRELARRTWALDRTPKPAEMAEEQPA